MALYIGYFSLSLSLHLGMGWRQVVPPLSLSFLFFSSSASSLRECGEWGWNEVECHRGELRYVWRGICVRAGRINLIKGPKWRGERGLGGGVGARHEALGRVG